MRIPNEEGKLGRYDERAEQVLLTTKAHTVLLIVLNGDRGTGFSVSTRDHKTVPDCLPEILELVAKKIREASAQAKNS